MDAYARYSIIHGAMVGICVKAVFILWVVALCMARRRKDPARTGFTWAKVFMPLIGM